MGSGIATALILSNINVILKEINNEYLLKGRKMIEGGYFIGILRIIFLLNLTFFIYSSLKNDAINLH